MFSPVLKEHIKRLESVQKHFIYRVFRKFHIPYLSYFDALSLCKLTSLEYRRLISDLVFLYKIIVTKEIRSNFNFLSFPPLPNLRRHPFCFRSNIKNTDKLLSQLLCNRSLSCWNHLPSHIFPPKSSSKLFHTNLLNFNLDNYLYLNVHNF